VEHLAYASFGSLFGRSAAVVHHGGIGTIAHALAAGLPQMALPIVGEQFDLAYRMERLGVGRMPTAQQLSGPRLEKHLRPPLSSRRILACCRQARERIDPGSGAKTAADSVEEVLRARG